MKILLAVFWLVEYVQETGWIVMKSSNDAIYTLIYTPIEHIEKENMPLTGQKIVIGRY